MNISLKVTELPSTKLEFGAPGEYVNPKKGLQEAGPFDLRFGSARKEQLRVGIVGNIVEIRDAQNWLERCRKQILSGLKQELNPDFPGIENLFQINLQTDKRWYANLEDFGSIGRALKIKSDSNRFEEVLAIYDKALRYLAESNSPPDVVICYISDDVHKLCGAVSKTLSSEEKKVLKSYHKAKGNWQLELFTSEIEEETEEDLLNRDFRRALKARAMRYRLPIQLGTDRLFKDSTKGQDPATRAWNFSVALYYKGGGVPWRLKSSGPETCFVGVSFHHLKTSRQHLVYSSIAQAFSSRGDGFAIKGETVPYDSKQGRNVHLTFDQARKLGVQIVTKYKEHTGNYPARVVIHKTSKFSEDEERGFYHAFGSIPLVELINLMPTSFRLVQEGAYPPKRGTLCEVNNRYFLFTTGYMNELGTYPGPHVPTPVEVISSKSIDVYRASEEILGLTRMNWNTASMTGGQPVTFFFARNVGGIITEYGDGEDLPSSFKYYM